MSSETTYDLFEARLRAGWTSTPLVFENENYILPGTPATFVFVEIYGDTYNQETMGAPQANMWEEEGMTHMHVMVPTGRGTKHARHHCNDLLYLFREQPIGSLFMPEMSIGAGSPGRDFPNYFAMTASINWRRYDITAISPGS